ncbi:MAG: hypothetical protein SGBAC_009703 [Bacillariaceae sp.]
MMEEVSEPHQEDRFTYTTLTTLRWVPRGLTHASVHEEVQEIQDRAFMQCYALLEVNLNEGLQVIGAEVFRSCRYLKKISVPLTVTRIGYAAFLGCASLTDVNLCEGLQEIGDLAFQNCRSLQRISVPSTIGSIRSFTFRYCESLSEVLLQNGLRGIDQGAFECCVALSHVSIPKTVHTIGQVAFAYCAALVEVELLEGLITIEARAFQGCTNLCAISIPSTTSSIKTLAFNGCKKLFGVELSSTREMELQSGVFQYCSALANVSVPSNVDKIPYLFHFCPLLEQENLDESNQDRLQDRYANLPIHELCYHVSRATVDSLQARLTTSSNLQMDAFGMTPLHILATSANLRTDLLKVLLEHFPFETVSQKDHHGKTMMDYLLAHDASKAVPMIQMALKFTVNAIIPDSSLEGWRTKMALRIMESIRWNGDAEARLQRGTEVLAKLRTLVQVEVTSIVELVLWKMKLGKSIRPPDPVPVVDRESCRMVCKADDVISNVVGFLWDGSLTTSIPFPNVLPESYHIISMEGI